MRGYSDDDELSALYLQFNAPSPVVAALIKGKFSPDATAVPVNYKSLPSWFDTSTTSTTRIYSGKGVLGGQIAILLYDPALGRVRFYSG